MNQTGESSQITTNIPLLNSCFAVHLRGVAFPCGRMSRPTQDPLGDSWDDTEDGGVSGGARKFKLLSTGEL